MEKQNHVSLYPSFSLPESPPPGFHCYFFNTVCKKELLENYVFYSIRLFNNQAKKLSQVVFSRFCVRNSNGDYFLLCSSKRKRKAAQLPCTRPFPGDKPHLSARLLSNSTDKFIRKKPLSKEIVNKIHSGPRVGKWLSPQSTCHVSMRTRVRIPSTHKEVCDLSSLEETGRFLELGDLSA